MPMMTEEELKSKMSNCVRLLNSKYCLDVFYVVFVVAEYIRYYVAYESGIYVPNNSTLSKIVYGKILFTYRNAFAHSESVEKLNRLIIEMSEYSDEICSHFTGVAYIKVSNALSN